MPRNFVVAVVRMRERHCGEDTNRTVEGGRGVVSLGCEKRLCVWEIKTFLSRFQRTSHHQTMEIHDFFIYRKK